MKFNNLVFGRPLASEEDEHSKVGVFAGLPMLGLDGLASAAYGPEAALTVLIPLGALASPKMAPVMIVILAVLGILFFSYRQTISAYPNGGGSYTVAKSNLGKFYGLLAAAALLVDYVLCVAVGISAGVGALVSAFPTLNSWQVEICLALLTLITVVNLRGVKESGLAFALPTYGFIGVLGATLLLGIAKSVAAGGHPIPVVTLPGPTATTTTVTLWLLCRSFASGCTAMTGVEAVSNGVQSFKAPVQRNAQMTLMWIVVILGFLLAAIAYLVNSYGIAAMPAEAQNYQSIISQVVSAIVGRGFLYYLNIAFVLAVVALSANTGFADFPRLCRMLALDNFMPHLFAGRGRRLVFSAGILILSAVSALLLIAFKGLTDGLIPLFAVGAFLAFTLSQAGMVVHWQKQRGPKWKVYAAINFIGCVVTGIALGVILVAKFAEGAWITCLMIPGLVAFFYSVRRHYHHVFVRTHLHAPLLHEDFRPPIIVIPYQRWNTITEKAMRFAMNMKGQIVAIHVQTEENSDEPLISDWFQFVVYPICQRSEIPPQLVIVDSPYRRVLQPLLDEIESMKKEHPYRNFAIVIPELIESHWYEHFLHNQRASALKAALLFSGDNRTMVINVPYHLGDPERCQ